MGERFEDEKGKGLTSTDEGLTISCVLICLLEFRS